MSKSESIVVIAKELSYVLLGDCPLIVLVYLLMSTNLQLNVSVLKYQYQTMFVNVLENVQLVDGNC